MATRYQWLILQDGNLPLQPDGGVTSAPHQCTTTLVWPCDSSPTRHNSLVIDPCFTSAGYAEADRRLQQLGASWNDIGTYFESHLHLDHCLLVPQNPTAWSWLRARSQSFAGWSAYDHARSPLRDLELVPCPGHAPELLAVRIQHPLGEVWIVSDAILSRQWLTAWQYYWPNIYDSQEVRETWRSVARILAWADWIVPGHGPPFRVDMELLTELAAGFPGAEQHLACSDVLQTLEERSLRLRSVL
ncbi:MAG: hypothetical protein J5I93_11620 [Pirellulaceae bacterium]|nr:hypothetical protein [Pirellulaceae bacterium]